MYSKDITIKWVRKYPRNLPPSLRGRIKVGLISFPSPPPQPSPVQGGGESILNHIHGGWSIKSVFSLPGQKSRRRSQKGPGATSPVPPCFLSAKRRGEKGELGCKRRKSALRKERITAFWARRMLFCPGLGPPRHRSNEKLLFQGGNHGLAAFRILSAWAMSFLIWVISSSGPRKVVSSRRRWTNSTRRLSP